MSSLQEFLKTLPDSRGSEPRETDQVHRARLPEPRAHRSRPSQRWPGKSSTNQNALLSCDLRALSHWRANGLGPFLPHQQPFGEEARPSGRRRHREERQVVASEWCGRLRLYVVREDGR